MKRIKKIGVSASALLVIFLLLGIATVTNNYTSSNAGYQILEAWSPSPNTFGQTSIPMAGRSYLEQPVYQTPLQKAFTPKDVQFYINTIFIPQSMPGDIQLPDNRIRSYEGKFGPYNFDPREELRVKICSQNRYQSDSPACEELGNLALINGYVVFGYANKYDEYIGYMPRTQYTAYYEVYSKTGMFLAKSNTAHIRLSPTD